MGINKTVRKENYERGMKYGEEVYCGQDLRDFIGMTIKDINSDDVDQSVMMWLEDDEKVSQYFLMIRVLMESALKRWIIQVGIQEYCCVLFLRRI